VAKRGPKSHNWRDLLIHVMLEELQRKRGWNKRRAFFYLGEVLNMSIPAVIKAAAHGEKLRRQHDPSAWDRYRDARLVYKQLPHRPRERWARGPNEGLHFDAVRDIIIYDEIERLRGEGHSIREACRLTRKNKEIMDWALRKSLGTTSIFNIYNIVRQAHRRLKPHKMFKKVS